MKIQTNNQKMFFCLGLFLVVAFFAFPKVSYAATSVTQYGITWTFDGDYEVGQFVNGDYWVVDPGDGVKIINISPGYTDTPRAMNGSMINPQGDNGWQGYDGFNAYKETLNVGLNVSPETPLLLFGDNSLVSTISNNPCGDLGGGNHVAYVKTAAVLTVLSSAPLDRTFRPGISSIIKNLHNLGDVDYDLLRNLEYSGTKPNISTYANYLQMIWLDHKRDYMVRYMHPSDSGLNNYYFPETFATAALLLNLNYTQEEKESLLINYIQLGIDLHSFLEGGAPGWTPDGGHSQGRKLPILFAGIMLNYVPMKNIGAVSGDYLYSDGYGPGNVPPDYKHFGEDGQTFYVAQSDVDITNSASWNPDMRNSGTESPYTQDLIGMPEWGIRHSTYPEQSDMSWRAYYRTIGSGGPVYPGTALAARFIGAKELWNNNAFFDYADRYMAISRGLADPFGYTVVDQAALYPPNTFFNYMWDTYRADYQNQPTFRADVDGSSEITTTDALLTLRNSLGLSMTSTSWRASATTGDVNCDGVSNSTDALLILRHSLGLEMNETSWCG